MLCGIQRCEFVINHFLFGENFKTRESGLRFGVMVRSFRRNIRIIIIKEKFSFKPIVVIEFKHSSNKRVNRKHKKQTSIENKEQTSSGNQTMANGIMDLA